MSARRRARAIALQVLYAVDGGDESETRAGHLKELRALIAAESSPEEETQDASDGNDGNGAKAGKAGKTGPIVDEALAQDVIEGVLANRASIDELLSSLSRKWRVERLARVDRNILRIAVYELQHRSVDIPARVVLNEAVELAKRFGAQEAPAFVNGLLDSALEALGIKP
jgi:N utilization substance protein B